MRSRRLVPAHAAPVLAVVALAACTRRAPSLEPAAGRAPATVAQTAARDSANAEDYRRAQIAYYQRVEWTYGGSRCAITDSRSGRTTPFACGRIRVGTQPEANLTSLIRSLNGRTVDLHPGDAPWRVIVVPVETEQSAILKLLADGRVRWAGLDFQPPGQPPARPRRPARRSGRGR